MRSQLALCLIGINVVIQTNNFFDLSHSLFYGISQLLEHLLCGVYLLRAVSVHPVKQISCTCFVVVHAQAYFARSGTDVVDLTRVTARPGVLWITASNCDSKGQVGNLCTKVKAEMCSLLSPSTIAFNRKPTSVESPVGGTNNDACLGPSKANASATTMTSSEKPSGGTDLLSLLESPGTSVHENRTVSSAIVPFQLAAGNFRRCNERCVVP